MSETAEKVPGQWMYMRYHINSYTVHSSLPLHRQKRDMIAAQQSIGTALKSYKHISGLQNSDNWGQNNSVVVYSGFFSSSF